MLMLERIWNVLFGGLTSAQLGFIAGALGFCWNQISSAVQRRKDAQKVEVDETLQQAVIETANSKEAKKANATIDKANNIEHATGMDLLEKAVDTAIHLAKSRKINLVKQLGGRDGVKAATQTAFKQVKNILRRDK